MFYDTDKIKSIMQKNLSESLPNYDDGESPLELMQKQSVELHNLAESVKLQAELAVKQSDSAKEESNRSNRYAKISIAIAALSVVVSVAAIIIPLVLK